MVRHALLAMLALVLVAVPVQGQFLASPTYTMSLAREADEPLVVGEVQRIFVHVERQCAPDDVYLESETLHVQVYSSDIAVAVAGPSQIILPEQTCFFESSVGAVQSYDASLSEATNATLAVVMGRIDARSTTFTSGGQAEASTLLPLAVANKTVEPTASVERSQDSPMPLAFAVLPLAALAMLRRRR